MESSAKNVLFFYELNYSFYSCILCILYTDHVTGKKWLVNIPESVKYGRKLVLQK